MIAYPDINDVLKTDKMGFSNKLYLQKTLLQTLVSELYQDILQP